MSLIGGFIVLLPGKMSPGFPLSLTAVRTLEQQLETPLSHYGVEGILIL